MVICMATLVFYMIKFKADFTTDPEDKELLEHIRRISGMRDVLRYAFVKSHEHLIQGFSFLSPEFLFKAGWRQEHIEELIRTELRRSLANWRKTQPSSNP